jgi:hypothetical protein
MSISVPQDIRYYREILAKGTYKNITEIPIYI